MFRTRKNKTIQAPIEPILIDELRDVVEEGDEGATVTRVVRSPKSLCIKDNLDMVTRDEYTLDNLLAAGIGLDQIDTSNLLSITDKADAETLGNSIASRGLKKFERKQMEEEFAAITAKNMENNTEKTNE